MFFQYLICCISFQDNRVTLQLMLVSPYVADLKPLVQKWMKNLEQLEEILELWVACQKKVRLSANDVETRTICECSLSSNSWKNGF